MMRTLSVAAFAVLAVSAAPAYAQDDLLDQVAIVVGGFGDGATVNINNANMVVTRTAPGAFSAAPEGGEAAATVTVTPGPEECVFDIAFALTGEPSATIRFSPKLASDITYTDNGASEGFNNYRVELVSESDDVMLLVNGDQTQPAGKGSPLGTSMTIDELNAAADAVQEACPAA